jgi:hypothetical protein
LVTTPFHGDDDHRGDDDFNDGDDALNNEEVFLVLCRLNRVEENE